MVAVGSPHDHLADERVVEGWDFVTGVDVAVDPHARTARGQPAGDLARGGAEVLAGILGVDPALNGMAGELDLLLLDGDGFAPGDAQLLGDQVDPRHHLGHGMFHLDTGVHFHEIEAAAAIHQEFHGARTLVANGAGRSHGGIPHLAP